MNVDAIEKMIADDYRYIVKSISVDEATGKDLEKIYVNVVLQMKEPISFVIFDLTVDGIKQRCNHQWVEYTGLHEVFNHCQKCGEKQT